MLPISTCHIIGLCFIFTVLVSGWVMVLLLLRKYLTVKHTIVLKYLILTFLFLIIAIAIDPTVFLISRFLSTIDVANALIQAFTYVSFSSTAVANIFFTMFLKTVFYEQRGKIPWVKIVVILELVVAVVAPIVAWMALEDFLLVILIIHVVTSLSLYTFQSRKAFFLRSRMSAGESGDTVSRSAMGCIGLAGIFLIAAYSSFLMQEIAFMFLDDFMALGLIDALGCSYFVPIAWMLAIISAFFLFLGYYIPGWIRRYWER